MNETYQPENVEEQLDPPAAPVASLIQRQAEEPAAKVAPEPWRPVAVIVVIVLIAAVSTWLTWWKFKYPNTSRIVNVEEG